MLSPLAHFPGHAHGAIIISVGEPPGQLEVTAVRGEVQQSNSSMLYPGLDLHFYEDESPTFGRHTTGFRKLANLLPDLVRRSDAVLTPMIKPEPHKRKSSTRAQWLAASFEPTPRSIRAARQFFGSVITQPDKRETGELLVSELTTNALRYATGPFEVRVRARPRVRVEVRDSGRGLPTVKDIALADESGRGLQIVDQLARSWGTEEFSDGRVVWFEL
jgi:anti-sigma regulatory factor (Ser/Thr protein kinase)